MKKIFSTFLFMGFLSAAFSQGQLSGDLQLNTNFYDKDKSIGANTTQYLHELSSTESWLTLNYEINDFKFMIRYDLFNNSPLLQPTEAYTAQGIGFYSLSKKINNLEITAGNFYDQFGSGIIFRAYEERIIGIDYAVRGIRLKYDFSDKFRMKAFTGRQKNRFDSWAPVMKGLNIEKDFYIGKNLQLLSGAAVLNRTLDQQSINAIADEINSYDTTIKRFVPKYNVFAFSFYNTLNYNNFSWYMEYAYKTHEAIKDKSGSYYIDKDGDVIYTTINYSKTGFGLGLQYKKTRTFSLRTSPDRQLLEGIMDYLPAMSKQNSKVLPARYSISALDFGEEAVQADLTYSPNKNNTITGNFSYIRDENKKELYREVIFDYYRKYNKKFKSTIGIQSVLYNKLAYRNHLDTVLAGGNEASIVHTITPFSEFVYKLNDKNSLRAELQYMFTKQDYGDFLFALLEYNIAPHYSFFASDMINTAPKKTYDKKHYYNFGMAYTLKQTRFMISYMKQVEGVVCTGGVCRVEPAFSGVKFNLTTNF